MVEASSVCLTASSSLPPSHPEYSLLSGSNTCSALADDNDEADDEDEEEDDGDEADDNDEDGDEVDDADEAEDDDDDDEDLNRTVIPSTSTSLSSALDAVTAFNSPVADEADDDEDEA